jgi:hypothetical protein
LTSSRASDEPPHAFISAGNDLLKLESLRGRSGVIHRCSPAYDLARCSALSARCQPRAGRAAGILGVGATRVDAKWSGPLSPEAGDRNVPAPFWFWVRNGLGLCCSRGPTARGHTSLGQRPRLRDGIISEGLKARPIGPPWRAPTGLRGLVRRQPGPLAQAGMRRAVGAGGGGGTERGFSNPRLDSWWRTGMSALRCPAER